MITISLCMIVRNEQEVLARCLESSAGIADEVIIVDTGSSDNTREIAKQFTDKVYDFKWIDDFSAARNYSFSKAAMDYIMWLDADDIIADSEREKLLELKRDFDPSIDAAMLKYNVGFDEQGNVTFSYYRERLLKRSKGFVWIDPVHEHISLSGKIVNIDICISHKKLKPAQGDRNLNIYRRMLSEGKTLSPRSMYYYARELYYNSVTDEAIKYFNLFLDSGKGWAEDNISACNDLAMCYGKKGDIENQLAALQRSFRYDTPRAEACCGIGSCHMEREDYLKAIEWFKLALSLKKPENSWGFILHDSWDFVPLLQLCVCYDRLGNTEEAEKYNEKAAEIKPSHPSVLYNRKYFEGLREKKAAEQSSAAPQVNISKASKSMRNKLTLSMLVRNEAHSFLETVLREHRHYIDEAVIIDDASTDCTTHICLDVLRDIPVHLIHNPKPSFKNEVNLRKQQWEETVKTMPDWMLCLDADEMFEQKFRTSVNELINQSDVDVFSFRLFDFWDEKHYREDAWWKAHLFYRPFLIRYQKNYTYIWDEKPQHCGRLPMNIYSLPNAACELRLKHLGWSKPELRTAKYTRYLELDPEARYGCAEQYASILDKNPNLVEWLE